MRQGTPLKANHPLGVGGTDGLAAFRSALMLASCRVSLSRWRRVSTWSGSRVRDRFPALTARTSDARMTSSSLVWKAFFLIWSWRTSRRGRNVHWRILPNESLGDRHESCGGCAAGMVETAATPLLRGFEKNVVRNNADHRRDRRIREAELRTPLSVSAEIRDGPSIGVPVELCGDRGRAEG